MIGLLRRLLKNMPTLLLAFILAIAVWISAVTAADPTVEKTYPRTVSIEMIGKDPNLVMVSDSPSPVNLTLSAPQSIWDRLTIELSAVRAVVDLSGLEAGTYDLPVTIQISLSPVKVISFGPANINVILDSVSSKTLPVNLSEIGDPAVGFQAGEPQLGESEVVVSGPQTFVDQVVEVLAESDIEGVNENVNKVLALLALNENGEIVEGITLSPSTVNLTQEVTQRGGYRNVVVKVITKGQIASGYRVTNISVFPPAVTVFSNDPNLVEDLPGYVETEQLDLTGVKDDLDVGLALDLPPGVSLIGEQTVEVQVGIATIEGSITLENMEVMVSGISEGYEVNISPQTVDVILSGPLPILDSLTADDVRIFIELEGEEEGIYQRIPQVEISIPEITVESILPASLEIEIIRALTPTSTNAKTLNQVDTETTPTPYPQTVTPTP